MKLKGMASIFFGQEVLLGQCTLETNGSPTYANLVLDYDPIGEFDRLTSQGFKLNLITGAYGKAKSLTDEKPPTKF